MFANCLQNGRSEKGIKTDRRCVKSLGYLKSSIKWVILMLLPWLSLAYPFEMSKANKLFQIDEHEIGIESVSLLE